MIYQLSINIMKEEKYIKSPLNYIGNKYKLLDKIIPSFPNKITTFVDLFGGSGVVSLNVNAEHVIYNDIVPYIGEILSGIKELDNIDTFISDTIYKTIEEYKLDKINLNGFKLLRDDYNNGKNDWWILYILMCYSFNSQFRFNSKHEYNSSFGKNKSCYSKVTEKKLLKAKNKLNDLDIIFMSLDFKDFNFQDFNEHDFVYIDPPYYGSIGNYNDGKRGFKGWDLESENQMRHLCIELNNKGIKFGLSNNLTVNLTLEKWVKQQGFKIFYHHLDYSNSSYQKKDKNKNKDKEVYICNY